MIWREWILFGGASVMILTAMTVALILILSQEDQQVAASNLGSMTLELWNSRQRYMLRIPVVDQLTLGRLSLCQYLQEPISVPVDPSISRAHITLIVHGGRLWLWDLSRVNPTRINGTRESGAHMLAQGDRIQMGNSSFVVTRIE